MANIGEETGPPFEEPAPEEWELPGYPVPTTEPAEQPATPEPVTEPVGCHRVGLHNCGGTWQNHDQAESVTIPAGTLRVGDRIRITHTGKYVTGEVYVIDEAGGEWRHLGTARGWFQYWRIASPITVSATVTWMEVGT